MFLPQSPLWQGDFCTQENASVRQVRARTMRAAVQNRPGRASGRTACEPSGPPIASDSPRTKSSDVAGAVGASGRSMSSDGSMLMSWHHAVSGCATVTSAAPSRNAAGIGLDPDATGAHPMGYAPVSAQRATLIAVALACRLACRRDAVVVPVPVSVVVSVAVAVVVPVAGVVAVVVAAGTDHAE